MNSLAHFTPNQLLTIFCVFDDLIMYLFKDAAHTVGRHRDISISEAATICLIKSSYAIQPLKQLHHLLTDRFSSEFKLPSYKSFVDTMNAYTPDFLILIHLLLQLRNKTAGVIRIMDSTAIPVCKNIRIRSHKVMKRIATRYKTTTGYFYGLKLHAVSDKSGNLLGFKFTTANIGDRKVLDEFLDLVQKILMITDAGYISKKLEHKAQDKGSILLTVPRKNMKKLVTPVHIALLNLRINIEHLFSVLKERFGLISSLPRSEHGYFAHYTRVIFGYLFISLIS